MSSTSFNKMAHKDCSNFDKHVEGSSNDSLMCLERKEDGNLAGAHLTYIRSCMKDMLCQIWSADIVERQREGLQRDNSPASEPVEEHDCDIPSSHLNIVENN
ncbi:hypothetical protein KR093_006902 [Drosophila rubida]|uniref:Uncharacterized protein n=1 Tax=Drosophila rubida TaxID=30044 RepID=A0AAD4KAP2_9MUSC|nr:hypothetical protein KR093_006902 [Drosophila rubida]